MNSQKFSNVRIIAILLIALVINQALYTGLYIAGVAIPRQILWGLEAILFTVLAAYAGAAMIQTKSNFLAWSFRA